MTEQLQPNYYKLPRIESYLKEVKRFLLESLNAENSGISPILSEVSVQLENAIEQVKENGTALVPHVFTSQKLRSRDYNEVMKNLEIDLRVLYDNLNSMVEVITQTTIMMDRIISKMVSQVDMQISRIRSLETLSDRHVEFDQVIHNSFTSDDNTYPDRDFSTINKDKAGIITLNTVNVDEIVKDELGYDLHMEAATQGSLSVINSNELSAEKFINSMDIDILHDSPAGIQYAIILVLPAAKWVNNVSFGQFSSHALTVDGIYYDDDINTNHLSAGWNDVTLRTDVFNFRNFNFNFEQVEARSIMIKVTQSKYKIKQIAVDVASRIFQSKRLTFGGVLEEIGKNSVQNTSGINVVMPTIVRETTDKRIRILIQNAIDTLSLDLESEAGNKGNTTSTYWYNIALFNLKVNYNRYQDDNIYRSPTFGGLSQIDSVSLAKNDNVPTGTAVSYFLDYAENEYRFDTGDDTITDVITVTDESHKQYDTDLFLDITSDVIVIRNGTAVSASNYAIRKPFPTSDMAYGITFDESYVLGLGDFITITYAKATVDDAGFEYNPSTLKLVDIGGKPNLRHLLERGNLNRMLVESREGLHVSYDIDGDEAHPFLLPSSVSGDVPEFGYGLQDPKSMNLVSEFPPYVELAPPYTYGIGFSGQYMTPPQRAVYYGIINESISGDGSTSTFNTENDYIPGSLHVDMSGRPLRISEYVTDTDYSILNDKDEFTTPLYGNIDGVMKASYIPISGDVTGQVSNIAQHNKTEIFFGTDDHNVANLEFGIYIDPMIIGGVVSVPPVWRHNDGVFVLERNNDIVYEPIVITIRGKKARNLTDYLGKDKPTFNDYSPSRRNYEYYIEGRKIFFNTKIDLDITVQYYMLPDSLALTARLYRTNRSDDTITPEVFDFSLFIDLT